MTTEFDKMTRGEWYNANFDSELIQKRMVAQDLCFDLNQLKPSREEERSALLSQLFGQSFDGLVLLSPFICDYGKNITFGKDCFVNSNCYFMDGAKITLGDNVFVGPSTGFYTANHPLDYKRRNEGLEKALPITIGDNVWFGANVNVMPGVTIGSGCVIASGSVVTHDIPANSLAAGVPCQVVREIEQE
ncbi:UNVERIFIED_CONTAM: sugar O-acetyltransferase [Streptococcus canis]|uniref:sugar O-acetyltransferase n=1 Tax=Streptococcus canis TaxID=1329 RepID=UPI0013DB0189|nr:sugar O-acetyltransferase [Streptococcus canis]QKG75481.1 sugar O-acetyltransferase [Streptococcus canis]GMX39454.1 sugar O-acetyltransferase [Streptococcus canis]